MSFLFPLYLAGAAAIALPIYLHLRRKPPKDAVEFSSLMFLEPSKHQPLKRRSQLEHLSLLALRCLALLFLAAMFSRPFFAGGDKEGVAGQKRTVILLDSDFIPVIAPIGSGENGETFNINGDTAAGAVASALKADRLLLLTDVEGVKDTSGAVLTELSAGQIRDLTADGTIAGGMIPKTETALAALESGVRAVVILDGRVPNACLLELFTDHGAGSLIRA